MPRTEHPVTTLMRDLIADEREIALIETQIPKARRKVDDARSDLASLEGRSERAARHLEHTQEAIDVLVRRDNIHAEAMTHIRDQVTAEFEGQPQKG